MNIILTIAGVSPLLCNRFTDAAQLKSENPMSLSMQGQKPPPREQAEGKLYLDSNGRPVIPGPNLFAAIVDAGRFVKAGKKQLTTQKSSLVPAGLALRELELPITPSKWETDSRAVVIPATGGRIMCHRPRFDAWQLSCTLEVDQTMFSASIVRELVDIAGKRIGLGDFRPVRRGPFGRFNLVSWKTT